MPILPILLGLRRTFLRGQPFGLGLLVCDWRGFLGDGNRYSTSRSIPHLLSLTISSLTIKIWCVWRAYELPSLIKLYKCSQFIGENYSVNWLFLPPVDKLIKIFPNYLKKRNIWDFLFATEIFLLSSRPKSIYQVLLSSFFSD